MKTLALLLMAGAIVPAPRETRTPPVAKINVVATTPDLAALAREIGGTAVDVKALAKPTEDPHFVDAKPSHIVTLNKADALIEGGAELELGWLPPLLESSRNSKIASGAPGRIVASQGIKMLEIPTTFDRSMTRCLSLPEFGLGMGKSVTRLRTNPRARLCASVVNSGRCFSGPSGRTVRCRRRPA